MTTKLDSNSQDPALLTFGKTQGGSQPQGKQKSQNGVWTSQPMTMLPPQVEGPTFGSLFIEFGNLDWLTYDGENYLEDGTSTTGKGVTRLFGNIKFWGDRTKGLYLKMANGMSKKGETVTNKYRYDIKCPEKTFEKYLDDMGVLVVDFFDTEKNQNIGTSKIMLKLFIKSQFPITLTGNQNVKIGQFNLSMVTSFSSGGNANIQQMKASRQQVSLDDSFEENEKIAEQMSRQEKNKELIKNVFTDDRIPSSYQPKRGDSTYKKADFDFEIDERPTRERSQKGPSSYQTKDGSSKRQAEKENQRNMINIDENEDTLTNQTQFERIFARGEKLRQQMTQAMDSDNAWTSLHGQHEVPKRYVPPFLKEEVKHSIDDENLDNIYALEIEGYNVRESQEQRDGRREEVQQTQNINNYQRQETAHIRDMKFIKLKINNLRVEDEGLLHSLIDETFSITVDMPLPDIYQKKIAYQHIKLSNYDIVSFNEFVFNSLSLYNFKIDEDTFNQMVQAELKVGIQGKEVRGSVSMIKLLMSKTYKLDISIPLEQTIFIEETQKTRAASRGKNGQKKGGKGPQKSDLAKKEEIKNTSSYQKLVGHITLEIQLQRGDTEEEMARDYQIKLQKLQETKAKEEAERQAELQKYMKFSQNQEPVFAQLYLNISNIRNLCLNSDGTLNKAIHEESFNQRLGLQSDREEVKQQDQAATVVTQAKQQVQGPKRNLFVQYKAFPTLDKLKTNTVWQESGPRFGYRSQFPVVMSPETVLKLQSFTFILEVWDAISPAQEEFVGLVKIPLASFCYSMKTTDEQIFSLNFLADQHCLYPMMVTDGYLPIYSPKLGLNIGELEVTLALGTAVQINRQIQKEQEAEKQILDMTFKTQMIEMMKQKQDEEAKLKAQIELQREQIDKDRARSSTPDRSITPKSIEGKFNLQENLMSGFNSLLRPGSPDPNQQNNFLSNFMGNYLKQSLNLSASRDVDRRYMTQLNCLIKLFEEARTLEINELNGDEIFKDVFRNFDGSIKKDDFLYALLNKDGFTFTRTEILNLQNLLLNITKNDTGNINIDELHFSYKQYLGYYESFQEPIVELLQLFKRNIDKKIEDPTEQEELIKKIEERAVESKIQVNDLKDLLDSNGILLRDNCYDQLSSFFDLDRNDQIYIPSFCEYMRRQSIQRLNFLKVSPHILTSRINNFIKEQTLINPNYLNILENEFKIEIHKDQGKSGNFEEIPEDILVSERINAKLFQVKLRQQGTVISLWEVFTFFDYLNTTYQKLYFEPQRYHHILFPVLYKFICGQDYEAKVQLEKEKKQQAFDQQIKASTESVFALAQDLNKKKKTNQSEDGIYSNKSEDMSDEEESEVVIKKDKHTDKQEKSGKNKKHRQDKKREMTFLNKPSEELTDDKISQAPIENRLFKKVKHVFEIRVKELKNIPILDKLIKDINSNDQASQATLTDKASRKAKAQADNYIQNVAVKYAFPLDDDELFQSDYIQLNADSLADNNQFDYKVSINTVHNYMMNKDESIQKLLRNQSSSHDQLFNISLAIYDKNKEFIVGNAQLPIEDLIDLIDMYDGANQTESAKQTLSRILFIYGTTFSQRENCIIGKMQLEIIYSQEKQYINVGDLNTLLNEDFDQADQAESCFLHKETYIKRKIPLNAIISVNIEKIHNLKECIENIEHFSKIQQSALSQTQDNAAKSSKLTSVTGMSKKNTLAASKETLDRRRILSSIFKSGLNITVIASVFGEDQELVKKFSKSKHTCKMLYNTLNPILNEAFELPVQMDTKIFEYLKNKKAKFEVRHYILPQKSGQLDYQSLQALSQQQKEQLDTNRSAITDDDQEAMENSDYIVIGQVSVPLLHLITKNSGIDGDFVIFDEYKQQMGALKLRINLNHHNQQRPLYSQDTVNQAISRGKEDFNDVNLRTTMMDKTSRYQQTFARSQGRGMSDFDNQFLLGINFVELVFKNRENLVQHASMANSLKQTSYLYLKFRINGQNFQTKFLAQSSQRDSQFLNQLKISTFEIKKTVFIELDFLKTQEIEEMFSKPLEVQLWFKKDAVHKYQQPEQDIMLGSFMIELNELSKIRNKRVKNQSEETTLQSYEGYFSLFDYESNQVTPDRLGCKLFLIKKEYETQMADAEVLFHNLAHIETQITTTLDPQAKGFADLDDLMQVVSSSLQDPYLKLAKSLISNLEYKNQDKVYYSPLFGTLPPFFKYIKRFDSFGVVEKFNKELSHLDTHSTGFIPLPVFRSVLEHELKIKEKIVIDFISSLRETDQAQQLQTLDVNLVSHSFKNHLDYVILLRKIAQYFEIKQNDRLTTTESQPADSARLIQGEEVVLTVNIESGLRFKNPQNEIQAPSCQVIVKLPFQGSKPECVQTQVIQESFYPAWHLIGQTVKFPITRDNLQVALSQPLEFEVYHHNVGNQKQSFKSLIGVAYADLNQMVFIDGRYQLSGYFHVLRKEKFADGRTIQLADPSLISQESQGQIKLMIQTFTNFRSLLNQTMDQRRSLGQTDRFDNQFAMSFAKNQFLGDCSHNVFRTSVEQKLNHSFQAFNHELNLQHEDELKIKHNQNMSDLDQLLSSLKSGKLESSLLPTERQVVAEDMRLTRGYNYSQQLYNQLSKVVQASKAQQEGITKVEEQQEIESEFDRENEAREEMNVFERGRTQSPLKEEFKHDFVDTFNEKSYTVKPASPQFQVDEDEDHQEDQVPSRQIIANNEGEVGQTQQLRMSNIFEMMNKKEEDPVLANLSGMQDAQIEPSAQTEQKSKRSRFDFDDEDDEFDAAEMARIQKILNSQRKQ